MLNDLIPNISDDSRTTLNLSLLFRTIARQSLVSMHFQVCTNSLLLFHSPKILSIFKDVDRETKLMVV
jgi:hypothetical protein